MPSSIGGFRIPGGTLKTCNLDGCDKPHRARGLCATHYNQTHLKDRHKKKLVACTFCGKEVLKGTGGGRKHGAVCSMGCRRLLTTGLRCELPADHWARMMGATCEWKAPKPKNYVFVGCSCDWCGNAFTAQVFWQSIVPKYCTDRCAHRSSEHKRGRSGLWISVKRRRAIYERDNWTCQICTDPLDKMLHHSDNWAASLDHIIPRSQQLVPDHSDSNLRLAHRWCNAVLSDGRYYSEAMLAA